MATFKQGDNVVIATREQTSADVKSGLYYGHFAGLHGTILKVYGEEASVLVDRETLPAPILKRHEGNEKAERGRYLDRLSEVARNSLGEKEKNFALHYAVLVSVKDLSPVKAGKKPAAKPAADAAASAEEGGKRLTENELSAAEEAFLRERAQKSGGQ